MARRFAQIQNEKAHWVFEAEEVFPHASYIEIVDVTEHSPRVEEGDLYQRTSGTFIRNRVPEYEEGVIYASIAIAGKVDVNLIYFHKAGFAQLPHVHANQNQAFRVIRGSVELDRNGVKSTHTAPEAFVVMAGVSHYSTALVERTVLASIFQEVT